MVVTLAGHSFRADLLRECPVVVDLGCCRGEFMSQFIQMFPTYERFVAVEANPYLTAQLNTTFSDPRVGIIQSVVRQTVEPNCAFYFDLENEFNSSCVFRNYNGKPGESTKVTCISVQQVVESFDTVDLVEMDIEGSEWEILPKFSV